MVSNSLGLVDFAIGLANSVLNLPDRQVKYFDEFNLQRNCEINSAHLGGGGGGGGGGGRLVEMMLGLVNANFSLQ